MEKLEKQYQQTVRVDNFSEIPFLEASGSEKYENAKGRLLLAADLESYERQSLLASRFEHCLQKAEVTGHPTQEAEASRHLLQFYTGFSKRRAEGKSCYSGSLDWADFKLHLKPKHQVMLLEAIVERVLLDTEDEEAREFVRKLFKVEKTAILNQHFAI